MSRLFERIYGQLRAMEAIGDGKTSPHLNARGQRLLNWLRRRYAK